MRKTKIIATLGPASSDYSIITKMVYAGANAFRLNFSHGTHEQKKDLIDKIRKAEKELTIFLPVIADLQGPSVRIGVMKSTEVVENQEIKLIHAKETDEQNVIPVPEKKFFDVIERNDIVYVDDGRVRLKAIETKEHEAICRVEIGGNVRSRVTIHIRGKEFDLPSLTEKDLIDLEFALKNKVDIIFQSFVRNKNDILELKRKIQAFGSDYIRVYAKIETRSAIQNIDEIIDVVDGILIARGDLGMYFSLEEIPLLESFLAKKALEHGKPVILATQILESMIHNPVPTRAEIVDIYNGVIHSVDAMMLSGETAIGKNPVLAVEWLRKTIERAEKEVVPKRYEGRKETIYENFAKGIVYLAESLDAKILAYTKKGATAMRLARYRPRVETYVASEKDIVCRQISLLWGIHPVLMSIDLNKDPIKQLIQGFKSRGVIREGEIEVITVGLREGTTDLAHVEIVH